MRVHVARRRSSLLVSFRRHPSQLKLVRRVQLDELLEVDGHIVAVVEAMLCDNARGKALERREINFVALDEGFEVV